MASILNVFHALLAIIIIVVTLILYRIQFHPLSAFPGPLEAKLSDWWRNRRYWRGTWHDDILALHKQYGPVVRISPNELSLVDAQALRALFNAGTQATKTEWYGTFQAPDVGPGIFAARDKKLHAFLRKRVNGAYTMSVTLGTYEQYMQEVLDLFITKMKGFAEAGKPVDIAQWTDYLAYDVIGTLAHGQPLGMLETASDVMDLRKTISEIMTLCFGMGNYWRQSLWLTSPYIRKVLDLLGVPNPMESYYKWSIEKVLKRQAQSKQLDGEAPSRQDILNHFVQMQGVVEPTATTKEVMGEMVNVIAAGADTTAISMRVCVYYMCKNPTIYRQVQEEVDHYYQQHGVQTISYQQTQELPLLCAIVREASRMFPAIASQLPRYAPEGLIVAGKAIPAGTQVSMSPIAANRDPLVFGNDADEFNPSRWLDEDKERLSFLDKHDLTFGGTGSRTCLGKNIAIVELHKFLAQLVHNFDVQLVDDQKFTAHTHFFTDVKDMNVRLKSRH